MAQLDPVILLAYAYPPDPQIGAWRPYRFCKYLQRLGHPVHVLAATGQSRPFSEGNVHRVPGEQYYMGLRGWRSWVDYVLRQLLFYDMGILWVPRAARYARRWAQGEARPVVISTSPPIHTHLAAALLKRRYGWKWIADFRDPVVGNPARKAKLRTLFDPFFEKRVLAGADLILANTDSAAAAWQSRNPSYADRVRYLWNGFDPEDFTRIEAPPPRDFQLMSHVGTVYAGRDPLYLLQAVRRLISRGRLAPEAFRICFYGQIPASLARDRETFGYLQQNGCLQHTPGLVDKDTAERIMRDSDLLLLVDFLEESRLQVPAKLYFYIRTCRPVVACTLRDSPAERILARSGMPAFCLHPDDSEEKLEAAVLECSALPRRLYQPNQWFLETFDSARQAGQLSEWIQKL